MAGCQDQDLFRIQQGTDTDRQRHFRHLIDVIVKETGIINQCFLRQGFDPRTGA